MWKIHVILDVPPNSLPQLGHPGSDLTAVFQEGHASLAWHQAVAWEGEACAGSSACSSLLTYGLSDEGQSHSRIADLAPRTPAPS